MAITTFRNQRLFMTATFEEQSQNYQCEILLKYLANVGYF